MKVNKKVVILVVVVLVMLGLWKGCTSMANQELLASITLHEVKQESFTKLYQTRGVVVAKKEVRYPIAGMIVEKLVNVGDVVKKEEVLLKYTSGNGTKSLLCEMEGIITEITESYISIAKKDEVWLKVLLPSRFMDFVGENDEVKLFDVKGKVVKISSIASYENGENYYEVYVEGDASFVLYEEVECTFSIQEYEEVYKVPVSSVVACGDKEYIVLDTWLDHVMDFTMADVVEVEVVGIEDGNAVILCESHLRGAICVLEGLSLSFVQEMLELNV